MSHPEEVRANIIDLYLQGEMNKDIAIKTNTSVKTVYRVIRDEGYTAKPGMDAINAQQMITDPNAHGYSTLYDADGQVKLRWVKTTEARKEIAQIVSELVLGMKAEIPVTPAIPEPVLPRYAEDRMNTYVFGDSHVNMLSWMPETGADWNQEIALQRHLAAMQDLISRAPSAEEAVLALMGDLLHHDSLKPMTANGTLVDVDGRLGKGWDSVVIMIRGMIKMMLEKYKKVTLVILRGNHSETLELILCKSMMLLYENEPRLEILDNTCKHIPYVWGNNFQLFTHGDKLNEQKKANIAVGMFRKQHGNATFTHVLSGHVHHATQRELSGVLVETFAALPSPDAWHTEAGFVTADQAANVLSYHRQGGITERTTSFPRIDMRSQDTV